MRMVALIDYGSGNIHSAARALREAASMADTAHEVLVTAEPDVIAKADRIVLPGVGHFADCAANLRGRDGLVESLEEAVLKRGVPFLGICVGMQLLADTGMEDGETPGLGWIPGVVDRIEPGAGYRIPHMGWNSLEARGQHPVLAGLGDDPHAYFVHSYAVHTGRRRACHGDDGLWWSICVRSGAGQYFRNAVSSREESGCGAETLGKFPVLGILSSIVYQPSPS